MKPRVMRSLVHPPEREVKVEYDNGRFCVVCENDWVIVLINGETVAKLNVVQAETIAETLALYEAEKAKGLDPWYYKRKTGVTDA